MFHDFVMSKGSCTSNFLAQDNRRRAAGLHACMPFCCGRRAASQHFDSQSKNKNKKTSKKQKYKEICDNGLHGRCLSYQLHNLIECHMAISTTSSVLLELYLTWYSNCLLFSAGPTLRVLFFFSFFPSFSYSCKPISMQEAWII